MEEVFDLILFRPLAFLLVKAIQRTRITPNQITLFSILVGVAAGIGFGTGAPSLVAVGAALYTLSVVLDCADGQLARLKKNGTRMGRLLDGMTDYIVGMAVYLGVAFGLQPAGWRGGLWWLMVAAAAASNIFHAMLLDYYRNRFLNVVNGFPEYENEDYHSFKAERDGLRASGRHSIRRGFISFYLFYLELQRRLTLRWQPDSPLRRVGVEEFRKSNRLIMRGWTYMGTSTQIVMMVACILFGRMDVYFWLMIVALNLAAAVLFFIQARIDIRLGGSIIE